MPVEGRDLSSRQTQYVVKDLEIGQPINSDECSETADGVARNSKGVKSCAEPDAGNRLSGSMSGERKRSVAKWPKLPRLSSTLPLTTDPFRADADQCPLLPR